MGPSPVLWYKITIKAILNICLLVITEASWSLSNEILQSLFNRRNCFTFSQTLLRLWYFRLYSNLNLLVSQLVSNTVVGNSPRRLKQDWDRDMIILINQIIWNLNCDTAFQVIHNDILVKKNYLLRCIGMIENFQNKAFIKEKKIILFLG